MRSLLEHELIQEILRARARVRSIIGERGGLEDVEGRLIRLRDMTHKPEKHRWRSVLAYVVSSFEQEILSAAFDLAQEEADAEASGAQDRAAFRIWLYQADGFTCRMRRGRKSFIQNQTERLQQAVAERAEELGVATRLERA